MILALTAALASDSGIVRLYDREVACALSVDPPAEAATCQVNVRSRPPHDDRPTWAIAVAPPGKLFVSMHMPAIDWGHVYLLGTARAYEPFLLSTGVAPADVCAPGEQIFYAHLASERGNVTQQACAGIPWPEHGEVLLESHRKLQPDMWIPIWISRPTDPDKAADVKTWFIVQVWISSTGTAPERPPQHPYVSPEVVRAWVPKELPPARRLQILGPEPEPEPDGSPAP